MQAIRKCRCVFGRNFYDTDETNSILDIRLTLYCPIFEEIKSSFVNVADSLNLRVVTLVILMTVSFCIFCNAETRTEILWCACKMVHWSGYGITGMPVWSSVTMQYIRTRQAEEKWSLHQYTFLASSCKCSTRLSFGRLDKHSKQNSRRLPPVVKATVRIFSSRTDLPQSCSFHTARWVPKIVFSATSSVLNGNGLL